MITVKSHLSRYPHARPSTLARIAKYEETHARLREEIRVQRKRSTGLLRKVMNVFRGK